MPLIEVEVVADEDLPEGLARRLADAAGAALDAAPGRTWVRLRRLPVSGYAESGGGPPAGVMPVFATVLLACLPEPASLAPVARRLAAAIAGACARPAENVHITFAPAGAGRVAFGGRLVDGGPEPPQDRRLHT